MDDDDDVIPHLQCDVELEFTGPNDATINKWVAEALRRLADSIENPYHSGLLLWCVAAVKEMVQTLVARWS